MKIMNKMFVVVCLVAMSFLGATEKKFFVDKEQSWEEQIKKIDKTEWQIVKDVLCVRAKIVYMLIAHEEAIKGEIDEVSGKLDDLIFDYVIDLLRQKEQYLCDLLAKNKEGLLFVNSMDEALAQQGNGLNFQCISMILDTRFMFGKIYADLISRVHDFIALITNANVSASFSKAFYEELREQVEGYDGFESFIKGNIANVSKIKLARRQAKDLHVMWSDTLGGIGDFIEVFFQKNTFTENRDILVKKMLLSYWKKVDITARLYFPIYTIRGEAFQRLQDELIETFANASAFHLCYNGCFDCIEKLQQKKEKEKYPFPFEAVFNILSETSNVSYLKKVKKLFTELKNCSLIHECFETVKTKSGKIVSSANIFVFLRELDSNVFETVKKGERLGNVEKSFKYRSRCLNLTKGQKGLLVSQLKKSVKSLFDFTKHGARISSLFQRPLKIICSSQAFNIENDLVVDENYEINLVREIVFDHYSFIVPSQLLYPFINFCNIQLGKCEKKIYERKEEALKRYKQEELLENKKKEEQRERRTEEKQKRVEDALRDIEKQIEQEEKIKEEDKQRDVREKQRILRNNIINNFFNTDRVFGDYIIIDQRVNKENDDIFNSTIVLDLSGRGKINLKNIDTKNIKKTKKFDTFHNFSLRVNNYLERGLLVREGDIFPPLCEIFHTKFYLKRKHFAIIIPGILAGKNFLHRDPEALLKSKEIGVHQGGFVFTFDADNNLIHRCFHEFEESAQRHINAKMEYGDADFYE